MNNVGIIIKNKREQLGWSQGDVAKKISVTQAALSNYERGKRRLAPQLAQKISTLLDINVLILLGLQPLQEKPLAQKLEEILTLLKKS